MNPELEKQLADANAARAGNTMVSDAPPGDTVCAPALHRFLDEINREEKPDDWVVEGMFERDDFSVVAAPAKKGKSLLLSQLAICIAAGILFLGWKVVQGVVVYFNLELPGKKFRNRIRKQAAALGVADKDIPLYLVHGMEETERLTKDNIAAKVRKLVAENGLAGKVILIVIDPWYALALGVSENDQKEVAPVLYTLKELGAEHKCAVFMAHNSGKIGEGMRGSSAFSDVPDNGFGLENSSQSEDHESRPLVFNPMFLRSGDLDPQNLRLDKASLVFERTGTAERQPEKHKGASRKYTVQTLVDCFGGSSEEYLQRKDFIDRGIGRGSVDDLIGEAYSLGLIEESRPKVYRLAEGWDDGMSKKTRQPYKEN